MQLKDKVALVTGSTTGVGEAIARRFAAEGAHVMVHGRREAEAETVCADIGSAGGEADYHLAALDDPDACEALIAATVERFGRIDILVNNAAAVYRSNLETTDAVAFDFVMAVNVRAPLLLIRTAVPHFRAVGGGCVLNIGSINGFCGEANQLAYSISKGGLITLSRNLADALGPEHIRVNHFNLGWVLSANEYKLKIKEGLAQDWPENVPRAFAPSGRILNPMEIAHWAVAFCTDAGGPVSGAVVEIEQYPVIGRNPLKEG